VLSREKSMNFAEFVRLDESEYVLVAAHRPRPDVPARTVAAAHRLVWRIAGTDRAGPARRVLRHNRGCGSLRPLPGGDRSHLRPRPARPRSALAMAAGLRRFNSLALCRVRRAELFTGGPSNSTMSTTWILGPTRNALLGALKEIIFDQVTRTQQNSNRALRLRGTCVFFRLPG
jgi:hypothetical protein